MVPRIPHHPTTAAARGLSATASRGPGVLNTAAAVTQAMRARIAAAQTAAYADATGLGGIRR